MKIGDVVEMNDQLGVIFRIDHEVEATVRWFVLGDNGACGDPECCGSYRETFEPGRISVVRTDEPLLFLVDSNG